VKVVYIAGKFTAPNAWECEKNVRRAEDVGIEVANLGAAPLIPHANTRFFVGTCTPEFWYEATAALLLRCDALMTVPGWPDSKGALAEIETARDHLIPVFHDLEDLRGWLRSNP